MPWHLLKYLSARQIQAPLPEMGLLWKRDGCKLGFPKPGRLPHLFFHIGRSAPAIPHWLKKATMQNKTLALAMIVTAVVGSPLSYALLTEIPCNTSTIDYDLDLEGVASTSGSGATAQGAIDMIVREVTSIRCEECYTDGCTLSGAGHRINDIDVGQGGLMIYGMGDGKLGATAFWGTTGANVMVTCSPCY